MAYEISKAVGYGAQTKAPVEEKPLQGGLELLANSATRLKEPNKEALVYGIDGCECPCPAACITPIEGTIIKGAATSFTGTSVMS